MAGAIELKAPNGVDKFRLEKLSNTSKTIDVDNLQDTAGIQSMIESRSGSDGGFSFRNKIVDGRFDFWYEGTTQSTSGYGSSTMWKNLNEGSTKVTSQQPLVAGIDLPAIDCPSAAYFHRTVVTSVAGAGNFAVLCQNIENVGTLAGKTATLSFYAKADSSKNIAIVLQQGFGSGGSVLVSGIGGQLIAISSSWKRYSVPVNIPSVLSKTIGVGSTLQVLFGFDVGSTLSAMYGGLDQQSGTFDIACVQLEEGTVATPFEELPIEISKMRVNRYYERSYMDGVANGAVISSLTELKKGAHINERGLTSSYIATQLQFISKRITPSFTTYSFTGVAGQVSPGTYSSSVVPSATVLTNNYVYILCNTSSAIWIGFGWVADARL